MSEKYDIYNVAEPIIRRVLDLKYDVHIEGSDNIPDQPALFTPNHIQFLDSIFVAEAFTKVTGTPLRFGAKQEYFEGKGIDDEGKFGRILKWAMEHSHQIPVERESKDRYAFSRLRTAVEDRIQHGDSVALHPEGTRSNDGRLHKFKSGAARLAIALSIPIVPTGLVYDTATNRRKTDVRVIFGQPIMPEDYTRRPYSLLADRPKAEYFTQLAENRVADLTGMEQSGIFAVLRKNRRSRNSEN